jgi:hypothetical protein
MAFFQLRHADGSQIKTECRRFSHYIGGVRYWFALHQTPGRATQTVSHYKSGAKVCDSSLSYTLMNYKRRDELDVARSALDSLVKRAGADRVRQVLDAAERGDVRLKQQRAA